MKLVANGPFDEARARAIAPDVDVVIAETAEHLIGEAIDADIVINISAQVLEKLLRQSTPLKWAHTSSAGVDRFLTPEFLSSDVILTCAKDGPAGPNLAEHAFALLLALTRNVAISARKTTWKRGELSSGVYELGGKTLGVIGYGGVGREMASRASAFGMAVAAIKKTQREDVPADASADIEILPPERLDVVLAKSDAVMIAVPDTPDTVGLFDKAAFAAMKQSAIIVNVGRGSTIVTDDLVSALEVGEISGAGLDVTDPEPLPEGHPLWSMDQVVITPHIAGVAPERGIRNLERVLQNLELFVAGRPLLSTVDKKLGY